MGNILAITNVYVNLKRAPQWLIQQLQEEDFLKGKTPEFSPDVWEDEE